MELPTQFLRDVLKSVLEEIGLDPNSRYESQQFEKHLLLSTLYKVTVHCNNHTGTITKNFIFKTLRPEATIIDKLETPVLFRNESMFYKRVMTAFEAFQSQRLTENSNPLGSVPRCYKAVCGDEKDVIVLEDLKEIGYVTMDRFKMLGVPELYLVVKELGRFHAISLAIKDKDPDVFADLKVNSVKEAVFYKEKLDKLYRMGIGFAAVEFTKRVKKFQPLESRYIKKLEEFATENVADSLQTIIHPREEDEQYNVFTHGDLWINNLLFHYNYAENCIPKIPDKMCFLDFQNCRYGSVALDISAVLFLLMDQKLRDSHRDELLQAYHQSLSEFLRQLGCDPEILFPFSALEIQMSRYSLFNLGMAFFLPFWTDPGDGGSDGDETVGDSNNSIGIDIMVGAYRRMSDECFKRIVDVLKESVDRAYLQ